ncbi:MAG: HEAT repeat domain-containing protein [Candidatus Omnitrophota bacterium]
MRRGMFVIALMTAVLCVSSSPSYSLDRTYKIKRLVTQLYDKREAMDAQRQLSGYGTEVTEFLMTALNDKGNERVRISALRIIADTGDSSVEDDVVAMLSDKSNRVRQEAARTLSVIAKKQSSVEPLKKLMSDFYPNVRYNAIKALAHLSPSDEDQLFVNSLGDYDPRVRMFAVIALGDLKAKEAVPYLAQMIRDFDPNVRFQVVIALGKIGTPDCLQPLLMLMSDPELGIRRTAIDSLAQLNVPGVEEQLLKATESADPKVVSRAIIALCDKKNDKAVEIAREQVSSEYMDVKLASITVLGKMGGKNEKPVLEELLNSESTNVRKQAKEALDEVNSRT